MQIDYTFSDSLNGTKPTLLLVHGFLESDLIWDKFTKTIDKSYNYLNINLPNHCKTNIIPQPYSLIDFAKAIDKVLVKKDIRQVILIGHSMGGYTNLAFAELFPEKVKGMILMNSSALEDTEIKKQERQKVIELVKNNRKGFLQNVIPNLFPSYNQQKFKKEIDEIREMVKQVRSEGIIYALQAMIDRPDRTQVLKTTNYPIQFIIGKEDPLLNYQKIMEQTLLPKKVEVVLLEKVGHMAFIEAEKEVNDAMRKFVKRISN